MISVAADMRALHDLADAFDAKTMSARRDSIAALDRTVRAVHSTAVTNAAAIRDTGALMESVDYDPEQTLTRRVFSDDPAGLFQETGTSRHAAQPWLTPAADRHIPGLIDDLAEIGARW